VTQSFSEIRPRLNLAVGTRFRPVRLIAVRDGMVPPITLHSKGPVWISTVDGSEVSATPVPNAMVNHDDAIPELLLQATEHHGAGQFGSVTYVQRLATKGGLAPKGPCASAAQVSVPYSASYFFYTAG
jgi:hypothetical protein